MAHPTRSIRTPTRCFHHLTPSAEGIPSGERPTVGCAIEGQTCALESNGESVTAALEIDSATVFVTVEVYYHIDSLDAEYPYDIVTYGFRV